MTLSSVAIMLAAQLQLKRLENQINSQNDVRLKIKLNEPDAFIHVFLMMVQATIYLIYSTFYNQINQTRACISFLIISGWTDILICCIILCMLYEQPSDFKINNQTDSSSDSSSELLEKLNE